MAECPRRAKDVEEVFRLDAKAEGEEVAIGGWRCLGVSKTQDASWFAVRLNRRNAPWAFQRGEAFRTIASLELLGALVGLMVLVPDDLLKAESVGTATFTCGTDNQGNSHLVDRLITTKYPLGVVLVELCHRLQIRNATLRARWLPRLQNEEADALTDGDFRYLDLNNRIEVDLARLSFGVLPELFEAGESYVAELAAVLAAGKSAAAAGHTAKRRRKAGDALRDRRPWI